MNLAERYLRACETPTDIFEHLPLMKTLTTVLNATKVIELGTRYGNSTLAWLFGLQGRGHLWCVDLSMPAPFPDLPGYTHIIGHDLDPAVLAQLPERADIVFIDTDHRYEDTKAEIEAYRPRVRPGGAMCFHDTNVRQFDHHRPGEEGDYPVRRAVDEWVEREGFEMDRAEYNNGFTVVWL